MCYPQNRVSLAIHFFSIVKILLSLALQACRLALACRANTNLTPFLTSSTPVVFLRLHLWPLNTNHLLRTRCTDNAMKASQTQSIVLLPKNSPSSYSALSRLPTIMPHLVSRYATLQVLPLQDAKPRPIEAIQDFMRKHSPLLDLSFQASFRCSS